MNNRIALAVLLGACAGLLLTGCQAKEEEIVETSYKSLVKLVAADAADSASFGFAVALSGDYAVIGAPGADGEGTDRGAAYIYRRSQGGDDAWGPVKTLIPDDYADGDFFGSSVDISGDYAVVGAAGENGSGTDQGAAYVFYRDQGGTDNWGQVRKIMAGDRSDDDGFGFSVSIDGGTIIVGSDGADGAGTNRGGAYLFVKDLGGAGNWGQAAKVVASDPENEARFGYAVAISGDLAIAGAPQENGAGTDRGAAYVFSRDLGGANAWGLLKRIVPGSPTDSSWFGDSVDIDGLLAIVGEAWDDGGGTNRGAAYIFARDQGGADSWGQVKKLQASDLSDDDFFGYRVSLDGANALVGAGWAAGGGSARGQAYVFSKDQGGVDTWGEVQRLRASDGSNSDAFGYSTAISGSYVLVGAVGEDGEGTDRGAAYLFKKI